MTVQEFILSRVKGGGQMATRKKDTKTTKKAEISMEKQLNNIKNALEEMTEEDERKSKMEEKAEEIREDLRTQLLSQNKFGKHFEDMVEDYIFLFKLKEELCLDIKVNGIRYKNTGGNGFTTYKPNESVTNILKVNGQMLKILQDLELKAPDEEGEGDDLL